MYVSINYNLHVRAKGNVTKMHIDAYPEVDDLQVWIDVSDLGLGCDLIEVSEKIDHKVKQEICEKIIESFNAQTMDGRDLDYGPEWENEWEQGYGERF